MICTTNARCLMRDKLRTICGELESANCCTEYRILSTIENNERASYNGSIEASQASDVGSIPIARSNYTVYGPKTSLKERTEDILADAFRSSGRVLGYTEQRA
jgi:hypothetical protein